MATTSTLVTFKTALVSALQTKLTGVQVAYAWPGPDTAPESVYLDTEAAGEQRIPHLTAGRKTRDEIYRVTVIVWVAQPDGTVTSAETCESRAHALMSGVEDVLADTPRLTSAIQWAEPVAVESMLLPLDKGWGCQVTREVVVHARLA